MTDFTALYEQLKRPLWGLGYLIAADVQDAEDALQDAFLALLEADTPDANAALGALARAAVRARRQRPDPPCTRVPAPVETQHLAAVDAAVAATLERPAAIPFLRAARWDALLALQAAPPEAAAAEVLHTVFGIPPAVAADLAGAAPDHTLRTLGAPPAPDLTQAASEAVARALRAQDRDALQNACSPDVELWVDGAGDARSTEVPLRGADAIARLFDACPLEDGVTETLAQLNGSVAWICDREAATDDHPPRIVLVCQLQGVVVGRLLVARSPTALAGLNWGFET